MVVPQVAFKYSWVYDDTWKEWMQAYTRKSHYHTSKYVLKYLNKVEPMWRKQERKTFREISKLTGLPWSSPIIPCYVVGASVPFSDPLTIPLYKDPSLFIDTLTHELIHRFFTEPGNIERAKKAWQYIHRKYKKENIHTRMHIPLHAIHTHLYLNFEEIKNLTRDAALVWGLPAYRRSWEIVSEEGYEKILMNFVERIQS